VPACWFAELLAKRPVGEHDAIVRRQQADHGRQSFQHTQEPLPFRAHGRGIDRPTADRRQSTLGLLQARAQPLDLLEQLGLGTTLLAVLTHHAAFRVLPTTGKMPVLATGASCIV
jgi:hypothetical protein